MKLGMSRPRFWRVVGLRIETELVGVEHTDAAAMILTVVAIATQMLFRAALAATNLHDDRRFFIFTRRVNWIVRLASFSNP